VVVNAAHLDRCTVGCAGASGEVANRGCPISAPLPTRTGTHLKALRSTRRPHRAHTAPTEGPFSAIASRSQQTVFALLKGEFDAEDAGQESVSGELLIRGLWVRAPRGPRGRPARRGGECRSSRSWARCRDSPRRARSSATATAPAARRRGRRHPPRPPAPASALHQRADRPDLGGAGPPRRVGSHHGNDHRPGRSWCSTPMPHRPQASVRAWRGGSSRSTGQSPAPWRSTGVGSPRAS
jgi:hypothetical protein